MIKGVIFDMDGLMFDTERLSLEGWRLVGRTFGYTGIDEFLYHIRGLSRARIGEIFHERYGADQDYQAALKIRLDYMYGEIEKHGVPIKPGLVELLKHLKEKGIPAALATSSDYSKASSFLDSAGVSDYFSAYVCGDMVEQSKPNPDIFLKAAKVLGQKPEDCLVLEDSPNGIRAGIAAGCHVIAIPDLSPVDDELLSQIDGKFETLHEVIDFL
jgi:HAD superfamily hydrolase (TIGR01509 family)